MIENAALAKPLMKIACSASKETKNYKIQTSIPFLFFFILLPVKLYQKAIFLINL